MAPFSRWSAPRSRVPLLVVLLVLTLTLTVVLAREAHQSSLSHHRVAQNVLRDYVEFASWEFGRAAQGELTHMYETSMTIASRAIPYGGAATATAEVTALGDFVPRTCEGCTPPLPPLTVFRMDPHSNRIVYRGAPLDDAIVRYLREVQPRIRQMLDTDTPCTLIIRAWDPDPPGGPQLVVGLTMTGGSKRDGTLPELHGFTGERAVVARAVAHIVEKKPLLPPSLTKHAAGTPVLSARVRDETGTLLYESQDFAEATRDRAQAHVAAGTLHQMSGRLKYEIALRPSMAESLVIGGLPRSRLALLLGLLALTTGLVIVALVQLRREYELARLRSEFVSGVSHELRTPLAQIRMFSETLLLGRVRSEQEGRRSLEIILQESRRLGHLVDNVLQFSKGQHRATRLLCEPRPLVPLLREVIDAFAPLARARRVTLRLTATDDVTAPIDASALRQIVLNLLDNAVKYGPADQTVTVQIAYAGGTARVSVEDEGPGIATADVARIWAPFARLPQASEAGVAGAGIGLSVVRELTQLHGGRVTVTTGASGGARFCVELPHATLGQPRAADDDAAALPAARSLTA